MDDIDLSKGVEPPIQELIIHDDPQTISLLNYDFESFIGLFKSIQINLNDFWVVNFGMQANGQRKYVFFIIRAYSIKPFFGPHLVSLLRHSTDPATEQPTMLTVWVHSLTFLRKELFNFQDRLSFERCTFLCPFQNATYLIRLKGIRGFLHLPQQALELPIYPTFAEVAIIKKARNGRSKEKMDKLLNKNIQALIAFISREREISIKDSIVQLTLHMNEYCAFLLKSFA